MIAILGGGISGLAAAYELHKLGKEFVLLESNDHLGGKIQSKVIKDYHLEMGPNTVLINNLEIKSLIDELGLSDSIILADEKAVKKRYVIKNGKIEQIPNSLSSAFQSNLFKLSTLLYLMAEPFKKATANEGEESLANFSRRRFGDQIYRDFITPFISGIYAGDPEKMSVNYSLSILKEAETKHGSVLRGMVKILKEKKRKPAQQSLPKQKIFSLKGGLQSMIGAIENSLSEQVLYKAQIQSISKSEDQSTYLINYLHDKQEKSIQVDQVISTIPAHSLANCIQPIDASLAKQLQKINYVPALVLHLGVEKNALTFQEKAFGLLSRKEEALPFLGVLFNSRFFPHTAPNSKDLLTIICGGYQQTNILNEDIEQTHREIDEALKRLLGLSQATELIHAQAWPSGIPQYELGYGAIKMAMEEFQEQEKNFYIAGNFSGGISVSDCISNARQLARKL